MKKMRVAVPSVGNGGLDGQRAGHFGHCDVFTCIDTEDGHITAVSTIRNQEHVQGGCMLHSSSIQKVITSSMNQDPSGRGACILTVLRSNSRPGR